MPDSVAPGQTITCQDPERFREWVQRLSQRIAALVRTLLPGDQWYGEITIRMAGARPPFVKVTFAAKPEEEKTVGR